MSNRHEIFIGDKIERALEIIEEENEEYYPGELLNKYADRETQPRVELRGNYLYVEVEE
jgi:hypothetical protein